MTDKTIEEQILEILTKQRDKRIEAVNHINEVFKDEVAELKVLFHSYASNLITQVQKDTAQECYLQCLVMECGEGECALAIKTKFDLDKENNQ